MRYYRKRKFEIGYGPHPISGSGACIETSLVVCLFCMTFEIALKRPLLLPHLAQKGDDKTPPSGMKRIHWVGDQEPARHGQDQNQGGNRKDNNPVKRKVQPPRDVAGYGELSSIMLGEVSDPTNTSLANCCPVHTEPGLQQIISV